MRILSHMFYNVILFLFISTSVELIFLDFAHSQPRPRVERSGSAFVAPNFGDAAGELRCASFGLTLECLNRRLLSVERQNGDLARQVTQLNSSLSQATARIVTLQNQLSVTQTQLTTAQAQLATAQSQITSESTRTGELERKTAHIRRFVDRSGRETIAFENTNVSISSGDVGHEPAPGLGNLFIGNGPDTGDTRRSIDSIFIGTGNNGIGSSNLVIGIGNTANGREGLVVGRNNTTDVNSTNSSILGSNDNVSFNNATIINSSRCAIDGVAIGCLSRSYSHGNEIIIGPRGGSTSSPVYYRTYVNDVLY